MLILGPTGSVGLPTLYLWLAANPPTTVLSSTRHIPFLESLSVNSTSTATSHNIPTTPAQSNLTVITYDSPSYTSLPIHFTQRSLLPVDLIIDSVGPTILTSLLTSPNLSNVVKPGGKIITTVAPVNSFDAELEAKINERCKECEVEVDFFIVKPNGEQLALLGDLAREGKLKGHVDAVFGLERGREAMKMVEGKRGIGRVVLKV